MSNLTSYLSKLENPDKLLVNFDKLVVKFDKLVVKFDKLVVKFDKLLVKFDKLAEKIKVRRTQARLENKSCQNLTTNYFSKF